VRFLADHQFSSLSLLLPLRASGCLSMLLSVLLSWIYSILVPPSRGQYKIAMATADIASNPSNLALFFPSQPRLNDSEMPFTASCLLIKYLLFTRVFRVIEIASNLRKWWILHVNLSFSSSCLSYLFSLFVNDGFYI
jgi:hypothetical protein